MSSLVITIHGTGQPGECSAVDMDVNTFYGGATRGPCLQLSIGAEYIQITATEATRLVNAMLDWKRERAIP